MAVGQESFIFGSIGAVIGAIAGAFLTFVTAMKKNRRDDFIAIVEILQKDNATLREKIVTLEDRMVLLEKERLELVRQIVELQKMLHVSK